MYLQRLIWCFFQILQLRFISEPYVRRNIPSELNEANEEFRRVNPNYHYVSPTKLVQNGFGGNLIGILPTPQQALNFALFFIPGHLR